MARQVNADWRSQCVVTCCVATHGEVLAEPKVVGAAVVTGRQRTASPFRGAGTWHMVADRIRVEPPTQLAHGR